MGKGKSFKRIEEFPVTSNADLAFGGYDDEFFNKCLREARAEGMTGYGDTEYEKKFSSLFFRGGSIDVNCELDEEYLDSGLKCFKAIASSFKPKHEHKTMVCAYILKSLCKKD